MAVFAWLGLEWVIAGLGALSVALKAVNWEDQSGSSSTTLTLMKGLWEIAEQEINRINIWTDHSEKNAQKIAQEVHQLKENLVNAKILDSEGKLTESFKKVMENSDNLANLSAAQADLSDNIKNGTIPLKMMVDGKEISMNLIQLYQKTEQTNTEIENTNKKIQDTSKLITDTDDRIKNLNDKFLKLKVFDENGNVIAEKERTVEMQVNGQNVSMKMGELFDKTLESASKLKALAEGSLPITITTEVGTKTQPIGETLKKAEVSENKLFKLNESFIQMQMFDSQGNPISPEKRLVPVNQGGQTINLKVEDLYQKALDGVSKAAKIQEDLQNGTYNEKATINGKEVKFGETAQNLFNLQQTLDALQSGDLQAMKTALDQLPKDIQAVKSAFQNVNLNLTGDTAKDFINLTKAQVQSAMSTNATLAVLGQKLDGLIGTLANPQKIVEAIAPLTGIGKAFEGLTAPPVPVTTPTTSTTAPATPPPPSSFGLKDIAAPLGILASLAAGFLGKDFLMPSIGRAKFNWKKMLKELGDSDDVVVNNTISLPDDAFKKIAEEVDDVGDELEKLNAANWGAKLEVIASKLDELATKVGSSLKAEVDDVGDEIERLTSVIKGLGVTGQLEKLTAAIIAKKTDIALTLPPDQGLSINLEPIRKEIDDVADALERMLPKVGKTELDAPQIKDALDAIASALLSDSFGAELRSKVGGIADVLTALNATMTGPIQSQIDDVGDEIQKLTAQVGKIKIDDALKTALEPAIKQLVENLSGINSLLKYHGVK